MKTRKILSTKERILDVAEWHFATYGFAGTSLRGIIKDAEANVAAVAYHYGTKEELFKAVVERFAKPVVTEQLNNLEQLGDSPELSAILRAFYAPPLKAVKQRAQAGETLALFLGRAQTEPEPIFSLVEQHYAECRNRFLHAFRKCIPHATDADLQWYFEFMLSLIVCFLTRQAGIRKRYGETSDWNAEKAIQRMIAFCESGMSQPEPKQR